MEIVTSEIGSSAARVALSGRLDIEGAEVVALPLATLAGAKNSIIVTPKFVGFHRCREPMRRTYFELMEINPHRINGHSSGDLIKMPVLMPEM